MKVYKKVGKKMNTSIAKIRLSKRVLTLIFSVLMAISTIFGIISLNKPRSAEAKINIPAGDIIDLGEKGFADRTGREGLLNLYKSIVGASKVTSTKLIDAYEEVKTVVDGASSNVNSVVTQKAINSRTLYSNAGNKDIVVKFGGLDWIVTYVSETKTGEVIATLWLANSTQTSQWSDGWYTKYQADTMAKQSNIYGSSYIRSVTLNNATPYTRPVGTSKTDLTSDSQVYLYAGQSGTADFNASTMTNTLQQDESNRFAKFTMEGLKDSLTEFIVKPSEVGWQETLSFRHHNYAVKNYQYNLGNESYGVPSHNNATGYYYNSAIYNNEHTPSGTGKKKLQYNDWQNDYIWLPALAETGSNNGTADDYQWYGIWNLRQQQRTNGNGTSTSFDAQSSWLRSGGADYALYAHALTASGSTTWPTVSSVAAVRPALHLNLKSAALAARGIDVPEEVKTETAKTYNGKDIAGLQYIDLTKSQISKVTLEKEDNDGHKTTATLTTAEYSVKDGVFYAANAGKYSVTFSIKNQPNVWDGTSIDPDTDLPYDPANVDKEVIYWEVDLPDGYTPAGPDDLRLQDQTITFTINKAETTLSDVRRTETGQLYTDGVLPALTCTTSVKGTITLDAGQTLHHDTTTYKWTFSPTGADCYNYKKKTGTIELSVKKPLLNKLEATFDTAAYASAVEAGTASPIYSSTPIENIKGIISKFVTIKGTKEDGKAYTGLISYDIDYTDTDKLNGKLSYGDNSSVKASYQDDDMQAEGVAAVSCLITGIPVIAVEMTGITLNTAYKTAYNAYEKFDTSALVVTATFNDNSTKAISLKTAEANGYTIEYADSARSVLWASDTAVTVKYVYTAENGKENSDSKTAAVTVAKIDFEGLTFVDSTVDYDGQKHAITVGGTFDATKMTAVYGYGGSVGDGRINVGSYTVSVVVTFTDDELITNYNEVKLADATLKIVAVDYSDLTNLVFNNATAEFIGQSLAEAIKAAGMPAGVTATYTFADGEGNPVAAENVKAVGTYTVTAKFKGDTNHNAIPDKTATLTITPKTIMLNDLSGVNSTYVYAGSAWSNQIGRAHV